MTSGIPPYALVRQHFEFPPNVEDRQFQIEWINALAPLSRSGHWAEVGTGKTFAATCCALYKKLIAGRHVPVIVLMPPILTRQWRRWLESITDRRTGQRLRALEYKGTPRQRKQHDLRRPDFILMSIQVFKRDFDYLTHVFEHDPALVVTVDEATSVKNPGSDNYKRVRDFSVGRDLQLLTGTPLSRPGDAYAYIKLISPQVYRNQTHFDALHVEKRDFFGHVTRWANLEFLRENLLLNSVRVLKEEAQPHLKKPQYDPRPFALEPEHAALYKRLADEQILLLDDGGKIDATSSNRLYTMLQQIICNPGHFSGDPNMRSAAHEMLDVTLDELNVGEPDGQKLIVFCIYNMTNAGLGQYLKPYGAVQCYGKISVKRQIDNIEQFKQDPECRVAILHPVSAGQGTDGLQQVCSAAHWMEYSTVPKDFTQGVGRLYRDGQPNKPLIRVPMAEGTIQVRLQNQLLNTDALVNRVQGGYQDLREAIYGDPQLEAERLAELQQ
jgi:SNF2 family DNA or RNA helicase